MKQKQKIQSQTIKTVEIHLNIKRTQIREKKENKLSHGNANQKEKCNDYINTKKKKMNFKENNVTKEKRSFKYDAGVRSSKGQNHEYLCT